MDERVCAHAKRKKVKNSSRKKMGNRETEWEVKDEDRGKQEERKRPN